MRPILFHIGSFPVRAYGTLIVIGFLIGLRRAVQLCVRRMKTEPEGSPRRVNPDNLFDMSIVGLFVGLLGARLLFVLLDWSEYAHRPGEILKLWEGGLSLHGGLLFGVLYVLFYCRRKKISTLALLDVCAPSWAIGYAFGRIGCLLNGCCYGGVCDLPWAVRFPDERYPVHAGQPPIMTLPSHPVQLYGTLFNIVFFILLLRWEKRARRDGEMFWGYIAMYGFYRYVVEIFRAGVTSTYLIPALHLTDAQVASLAMILVGLAGIAWLRNHRPAYSDAIYAGGGESTPVAENTSDKHADSPSVTELKGTP